MLPTIQCELTGVPRSTAYRQRDTAAREGCITEDDGQLCALIDKEYSPVLRQPTHGGIPTSSMAALRQSQARAAPYALKRVWRA